MKVRRADRGLCEGVGAIGWCEHFLSSYWWRMEGWVLCRGDRAYECFVVCNLLVATAAGVPFF